MRYAHTETDSIHLECCIMQILNISGMDLIHTAQQEVTGARRGA